MDQRWRIGLVCINATAYVVDSLMVAYRISDLELPVF